ncbi:predicted protein [Postia placenta Mad-698-R]|nr:predicted protein [Postia placenta Mad-698-R]
MFRTRLSNRTRTWMSSSYTSSTLQQGVSRNALAIILDPTEVNVFDETVKGTDTIEHTTSPVHLKADKADEIIFPAIFGASRTIGPAFAHGSSVKSIHTDKAF